MKEETLKKKFPCTFALLTVLERMSRLNQYHLAKAPDYVIEQYLELPEDSLSA